MAEPILRLADSFRHGSALLRETATEWAEGRGTARLSYLLADAEIASREQAACARGLLDLIARAELRQVA